MRSPAMLLVVALALLAVVLASSQRAAQALPPAGTDVLPVVVTSDVASLLGNEPVVLKGWLEIGRSEPYLDGAVEVVDLAVVNIELVGASQLGLIEVDERAAAPSSGEIRSLQPGQDFPASSFLDLFVEVSAPASPFGPLVLHNETVMRLTPREGGAAVPIEAWPPLGVTYELKPIFGVDNDGDGEIDEDTPDDDGDGRVDEDRPGPDPDAPLWEECGDDADCDVQEGEDPPVELCSPALCDGDGDGEIDEDPECVPLFNDNNTHLKFAFCVRSLPLEIAPEFPSYSAARGGPSHLRPADILALAPLPGAGSGQAPVVRIACADLGLTADGCDDGADGDQDDLDALSYGDDFPPGAAPRLHFSVAPGAIGAPGSAVEEQQHCPPSQPGLSPEPQGDEFGTDLDGTNEHVLDGNGPVGACASAFPLGLVEAATQRDDLDALDERDSSAVDQDGDGVPDAPVYFSLDAASPSLALLGRSAADVLMTANGSPPAVYASAGELGLQPGDDLDALCLRESGDGTFGIDDQLSFSLAAGSPMLSQIGAAPADILAPATPPSMAQPGPSLGVMAGSDVNALKCAALLPDAPGYGDVNCDGLANSIDAALLLQYVAGLVASLPCFAGAGVNLDGAVDSIDAALILQLEAGLIDHLPVP